MRFTFWYISLPSSPKWRREMTKFKVLWRTLAHDDEFSVLSLRFQPVHTSLIPPQWLHIFNAKPATWNSFVVIWITRTCIFKWSPRSRRRPRFVSSLMQAYFRGRMLSVLSSQNVWPPFWRLKAEEGSGKKERKKERNWRQQHCVVVEGPFVR